MSVKDAELSILIPARNEMFLAKTIDSLLANIRANTEIIAVLDGSWAEPPIQDHPRVTLVYHPEVIGQRAAINEAAGLAKAKWVMKLDAHCDVDEGFDVKLLKVIEEDMTLVPTMRNLHAFNWVCECGWTQYQGPTPSECPQCGNKKVYRDVVWIAKTNPQSKSFCFDSEPHFQYFRDYSKRQEGKGELTETMSLQGSCFMLSRDRFFELNVCDESFGSWGSQGIEVAIKSWLSGGRCMCLQTTWYAHLFRTQGGDFGFPYAMSNSQTEHAKRRARELFFENKWDKAVRPLSWLVEKFWPVPGWTDSDLAKVKANER